MSIKSIVTKLYIENHHLVEEKSYPDLINLVRREIPDAKETTIKREARNIKGKGQYKIQEKISNIPPWIKLK